MLHLGQKLGWVFENRALKKFNFFKSVFRQVPHLEKNVLLIINQNASLRPKKGTKKKKRIKERKTAHVSCFFSCFLFHSFWTLKK